MKLTLIAQPILAWMIHEISVNFCGKAERTTHNIRRKRHSFTILGSKIAFFCSLARLFSDYRFGNGFALNLFATCFSLCLKFTTNEFNSFFSVLNVWRIFIYECLCCVFVRFTYFVALNVRSFVRSSASILSLSRMRLLLLLLLFFVCADTLTSPSAIFYRWAKQRCTYMCVLLWTIRSPCLFRVSGACLSVGIFYMTNAKLYSVLSRRMFGIVVHCCCVLKFTLLSCGSRFFFDSSSSSIFLCVRLALSCCFSVEFFLFRTKQPNSYWIERFFFHHNICWFCIDHIMVRFVQANKLDA